MRISSLMTLGIITLAITFVYALAEVKLPAIISDNMVLQQGDRAPVWGWAGEGEKITVTFQDREYSTKAEGGRWKVMLQDLKPGGPFQMTIAGQNSIELKNMLVGEVWVCSGQSNMAWTLNGVEAAATEVANSGDPRMRLFRVSQKVAAEPAADVEGTAWRECRPESAGTFSAVGYYFGRSLRKSLGVPVGLIDSSFGGSVAVAWVSMQRLKSRPDLGFWLEGFAREEENYVRNRQALKEQHEKAMEEYRKKVAEAGGPSEAIAAPRPPQDPKESSGAPSGLFNGMIAPLLPFSIKGVIWYQGESDAFRAETYMPIFEALVQDWRQAWGVGDFPFLYVQLAGFAGRPGRTGQTDGSVDRDWPRLREVQLKALRINKTAMAVAVDVGAKEDIHPRNKKPVGERLALAARAVAYGEPIVYSGPLYKSFEVGGDKIALTFDHVGSGLEAKGGELTGFTICGEDRKFVDARAEFAGEQVIVSSPEVKRPVAVRYAWTGFPACNLYNKERLPASPFRTDDFPVQQQPPGASR